MRITQELLNLFMPSLQHLIDVPTRAEDPAKGWLWGHEIQVHEENKVVVNAFEAGVLFGTCSNYIDWDTRRPPFAERAAGSVLGTVLGMPVILA